MRKWLLGHRKLVTTCIIVISILLMISSSLLFFKFQKEQNVYVEILYLIFDYPHKHYTFKYFEV